MRPKPGELKNAAGASIIQITSMPGNYHLIKSKVESLESISSCSVNEKGLKITLRDEVPIQTIFEIFEAEGEKINSVESTRPSLEDVFIKAAGMAWH